MYKDKILSTLQEMKNIIETLQDREKELRSELMDCLKQEGSESYENDFCKVTIRKTSESVNIDVKAIENKNADLYVKLLADYPNITKRAESLAISFKEAEE